jgi:hypothetical protein
MMETSKDQTSDTIYNEAIRYFLAVNAKVIVVENDTVPADFHVPTDFDLEQASPRFQQKVYRKMLESFIKTFEKQKLRELTIESIRDLEDGLDMVINGFFSLKEKENDSTDKDFNIELNAVKQDLLAVNEPLKEALSEVGAAIAEYDDNGGKKTAKYILSLQNCRDKMSEIKIHLRAWLE